MQIGESYRSYQTFKSSQMNEFDEFGNDSGEINFERSTDKRKQNMGDRESFADKSLTI